MCSERDGVQVPEDAQLLDHFEQVYLGVELLQALLEEVVVPVELALTAWAIRAAPIGAEEESYTAPFVEEPLHFGAPCLTVAITKDLPLHNRIPHLLLLTIIIIVCLLLVK